MSLLIKFNEKLNTSVKYLCFLIFVVMITASFGQVIWRYVFEQPLTWSEELARYMAIWLAFLGVTIALKENCLAYVEAFVNMMPKNISRGIAIVVNLLSIAFCGMMSFYGTELVGRTMGQVSPAMSVPMELIYLTAPVSGIVMILYLIESTIVVYNRDQCEGGA